jgi:HEPN domain-containing protein
VEKVLKVALTLSGVDFPKTHDLDFLLALCSESGIELPPEMAHVGWLTPWAAEFRYDDPPLDSLDRDRATEVSRLAVERSSGLIRDL